MSDEFRDFEFGEDSPFAFESDEFAFAESGFDCGQIDCAWNGSPEEELVALADEPPRPRAGLRSEFLDEVVAIERRREQLRRVPVIAACLLAASVGFFRPPNHTAPRELSDTASRNGELPIAAGIPDELLSQFVLSDSRAAVQAAGRNDDNWGLVDACRNLRTRQYESLQQSLTSDR